MKTDLTPILFAPTAASVVILPRAFHKKYERFSLFHESLILEAVKGLHIHEVLLTDA